MTFVNSRSLLNSSTPTFNPSLTGYFDFYITQTLLQGFSPSVNSRDIKVAKNNQKYTDIQVKLQVATTVSAVLNLYWDLVSFNEAVHIKEEALKTAQNLFEGNKKQVAIGALAGIEVTRAAAEVSASKEDLLIAQTNVQQQEIVLKNALNRNGIQNTWLDDVRIVPLDHIEVPKTEEVRPVQDLIQEGMEHRLEIEQSKINLGQFADHAEGQQERVDPAPAGIRRFHQPRSERPEQPAVQRRGANEYFVGGNGNVFAQVFRRNFPDYSAGVSLNIPFRNRTAQADYVTDQLQVRQKELQLQRAINQVRVEVKTSLIGLQQARSRYETAVATRVLAEQTLEAEQKRFQGWCGQRGHRDSGAEGPGRDPGWRSAGDGQLHARQDRVRSRLGTNARRQSHLDRRGTAGHVQRESIIPTTLPAPRAQGVGKWRISAGGRGLVAIVVAGACVVAECGAQTLPFTIQTRWDHRCYVPTARHPCRSAAE